MKLDRLANAAIIVVCTLMAIHLARNFYLDRPEAVPTSATTTPSSLREGQSIPSSDELRFSGFSSTIVLVTDSRCRFCTESMPFYRQLVEVTNNSQAQIIGAAVEDLNVNSKYLADHGVRVGKVVSVRKYGLQTGGTPTVIHVDAAGKVQMIWRGKLPKVKEDEVISRIGAASAPN